MREKEVPTLAEPDVDAELLGEAAHEVDRLFCKLDQERRRPLCAHPPAVPPRRPFTEVTSFKYEDFPGPRGSEVPRERQPHDPATDDHDVDFLGKRRLRL